MSLKNYALLESVTVLSVSVSRQIASGKQEFVDAFENTCQSGGWYLYTDSLIQAGVALNDYEDSRNVNPDESWDGWDYLDFSEVIDGLMTLWAEKPVRTAEEWREAIHKLVSQHEWADEAQAKWEKEQHQSTIGKKSRKK